MKDGTGRLAHRADRIGTVPWPEKARKKKMENLRNVGITSRVVNREKQKKIYARCMQEQRIFHKIDLLPRSRSFNNLDSRLPFWSSLKSYSGGSSLLL
jgi:hypothetical protein